MKITARKIESILAGIRLDQLSVKEIAKAVADGINEKFEVSSAPPTPERLLLEERASQIYSAYPKRVGKPAAVKSIVSQLKKYDFDELLYRTKQFAALWENSDDYDKQFCPHPSTWFNQERFNNNPDTWGRPKSKTTPKLRTANI